MQRRRPVLTKVALPMDLVLTAGPLANVDIEGKRVPPKAISTSFGGCLEIGQKTQTEKGESSRAILGKKGARSNCARQPCYCNFPEVRTSSMRIWKTSGSCGRAAQLCTQISSGVGGWGGSLGFFLVFFCFKKFPLGGVTIGPGTFCR